MKIEYQVEWSLLNDAVWIHASDGSTVGRFGKMGVDLHTTVTEPLQGAPNVAYALMANQQWKTGNYLKLKLWNGGKSLFLMTPLIVNF